MARRVIARITADTMVETATTTAMATPSVVTDAGALLGSARLEVMCCWCHFERSGMRSLPAGVDDQTCARHVAELDEQRLQRRIERLRLEAETAETEETAETLAALKRFKATNKPNKIAREPA